LRDTFGFVRVKDWVSWGMDSAGQAALVSGKRSEGVHVWRFFLAQGLIKTAFSFGIDVAFGAD
jgi:hypothetical protein